MRKYNLSNSEEILMNTLWKENAPLTVAQLSEKITEADWKPNYVDKLVKQLVKKGMIKADGIQQDRFYRSQQFVSCLTKDEFLANMLEEQGVNNATAIVQKRPQTAHAGTGRKADCGTRKDGR